MPNTELQHSAPHNAPHRSNLPLLAGLALGALCIGLLVYKGPDLLKIWRIPSKQGFLKRTKPIAGIVIHHTHTGSAASTVSVLEQRGFSTNYEVDQAGVVREYADPELYEAQATGGGANAHTIGIDLTHIGEQPFPQAQIDATKALLAHLAQRFKFKLKLAPDEGGKKTWKEWQATGQGYTLFRHRNFANTRCPANAPMELFV
jgi:hypothetical protein